VCGYINIYIYIYTSTHTHEGLLEDQWCCWTFFVVFFLTVRTRTQNSSPVEPSDPSSSACKGTRPTWRRKTERTTNRIGPLDVMRSRRGLSGNAANPSISASWPRLRFPSSNMAPPLLSAVLPRRSGHNSSLSATRRAGLLPAARSWQRHAACHLSAAAGRRSLLRAAASTPPAPARQDKLWY